MSYNCDGCGKTTKLVSTKNGEHLCQSCYKEKGLEEVRRCHNCDKYFQISESPDGGTTCSEKCSSEYLTYLNDTIEKSFQVTTIKKEDLIGHRKVDLQGL